MCTVLCEKCLLFYFILKKVFITANVLISLMVVLVKSRTGVCASAATDDDVIDGYVNSSKMHTDFFAAYALHLT